MQQSRIAGLLIFAASAALFIAIGSHYLHRNPGLYVDFKAFYYGSRCLLAHGDPYDSAVLDRFFIANGGMQPGDPADVREIVSHFVNFPAVLLFAVPFALLPWSAAHLLWTTFTFSCCYLAGILIWRTCAPAHAVLSAVLIGFTLASCQVMLLVGNTVGFVVGLTVIAAWCFIGERFGRAGVLALALALVLKPQDAGLVWLFFLLAGGSYRRRALQTLGVAAAFSLIAGAWAFQISPDWPREQHVNFAYTSSAGGMNDPGPGSHSDRTAGAVIDLQTVAAVFRNSPSFYNLVTYVLCGIPLIVWARRVYRTSPTGNPAWFALAAVVPLSMLITYHRLYDLKLLLLALPACFLLWNENNTRGQAALLLTAGSLFITADLPFALYNFLMRRVPLDLHSLSEQLTVVFLLRPAPLILIVLTAFYLTVFLRQTSPSAT